MGLGQKQPSVSDNNEDMPRGAYLQTLMLLERLHRELLDVVKDELDRCRHDDINSVQALLIFNIGEDDLTAGELRSRGHYLGSNVSYNLKKLVDAGYLSHERSSSDRRSVRISLTKVGLEIRDLLAGLFDRQLKSLAPVAQLDSGALDVLNTSLVRLERFWSDHIRYRM